MRATRRIVAGAVALALTLAIGGCGDDETALPDVSGEDLLVRGPNPVGYHHDSLTYRPRGMDTERTLELEIWYPAVPDTGTPTTYRVAGVVEVERPEDRTNADLIPDVALPVLVYSHGNGGVALVGFSDGEYFASWGWLVVAPDHTGNTLVDPGNPTALNWLTRPQDVSAVLDWLQSGAPEPFAGRASENVLVVGHSFGAYSALSVAGAKRDVAADVANCTAIDSRSCDLLNDPDVRAALETGFADPRVDAVVPQAGVVAGYASGELARIALPTLWMAARADQTVPWETNGSPGWTALDGPDDVWVDLSRGGHYSFIEACDVVDHAILEVVGFDVDADGCGPDFTPISEIMPVVHAYVHAFARAHVLGEPEWDGVFDDPVLHPDVTLTRR